MSRGADHATVDGPAAGRAGPEADHALAGFTVAITADRRRDELAALLERRGARTVTAPTLRIVPIADDADLRARTVDLVRRPPGIVFGSTGIGIRGWLEAAEGWGLAEPLRAALGRGYLVARGAKARGAIRAAGLVDDWSPDSECCEEVLAHLLERGVAGERVAVQLHGDDQPEFVAALRAAGAEVVEVTVYRWAPPADAAPVRRLVDLIVAGGVDAVAFTSAPAVRALLAAAGTRREAVLHALRTGVLAACIGQVTAAPLREAGVPVVAPARARLGGLARTLVDELPGRAPTVSVNGHELTVRGYAAVVDGRLRPLGQSPMAVLRQLVGARGRVCSRGELLDALPRGADEHAVEMAVARLRTGLGGGDYVRTVVKRGYRLAVDEPPRPSGGRDGGWTGGRDGGRA